MSLILAIEPDRRQAAKVYALADTIGVELLHGETTEAALHALGTRVPDLVLTSQLLSPKDETALADRLRELDAAGLHVPTLVIPVLRGDEKEARKKSGGFFGRLRRSQPEKTTEGCDPAVFATEISEYLARSAADRAALAQAQADLEAAWAESPVSAPAAAERAEPAPGTVDVPLAPAPPTPGDLAASDALAAVTAVSEDTRSHTANPDVTAPPAEDPLDALFAQSAPVASRPPDALHTEPTSGLPHEQTATFGGAIDVHPGMVIENPEELFGEFAAIPIRPAADPTPQLPADLFATTVTPSEQMTPGTSETDASADVAANFEALFGPTTPVSEAVTESPAPPAPDVPALVVPDAPAADTAAVQLQAEDEWEEISLDAGEGRHPGESASESSSREPHHELTSEPLDLDEFVRELATVRSSANAQPMIPVVDLSHVLAGDVELPEPELVPEEQLKQEERATFDAEVAAVFASEPEITFEAEPELAEEPVVAHPEPGFAAFEDAATLATAPDFAPDSVVDPDSAYLTDPEPVFETAPEPAPTPAAAPPRIWPEFPDLKVPAWQSPAEGPVAPERWRAALDSIAAPAPLPAPTADLPVVKSPGLKPGWTDMLSAIQRDIDQRKTDDEPVTAKPRTDFSSEPLVFPKRPTVAASLIANLEPPRAFKQTIEPTTPRPDLNAQADALKKLLDTVVVPKAETTGGRDATMADSVGSEAAALQAALSGINVADVAASEKVEPLPDLTNSPVWAGGATLTESLGTATEAPVRLDAVSPEAAAADLRVVDLSWLNAPAAAPETIAPPVAPVFRPELESEVQPTVVAASTLEPDADCSADEMSLEELELATRPDSAAAVSTAAAAAAPVEVAPATVAAVPSPEFVGPSVDLAHPAPVDAPPDMAAPERDAKPPRTSKSGRKKRKHGQGETAPLPSTPTIAAVDTDFGFFDPHKHGFMPLVARLNQLTGGGLPLR